MKKQTKTTPTKAQRILNLLRKDQSMHGKTAAEIAEAANVDHNHVYIFEGLVFSGHLKRNGGPNTRTLLGFEKDRRGGRGVTYLPGRNFEVELTGRSAATKTSKKNKKTGTKSNKTGTTRTRKTAAVVDTKATGNTVTLEVPETAPQNPAPETAPATTEIAATVQA